MATNTNEPYNAAAVPIADQEGAGKEHKDFDFTAIVDGEFEDKNAWWSYYLKVFGMCYVLFNGIITLMGLAWAHMKTVTDGTNTGAKLYIAVYGPLVFFFLYFLLFNNYYSEQVYYMFLKRGAVISFPNSQAPAYWTSTPTPYFFVIGFSAYLGYMLWVFGSTGAPFPTYYVFISNIVIQIFLFWMNQQSIEARFVTVSNYIASFKNKAGEREGVDATNLKTATGVLASAHLVVTKDASYTNYMAQWYWDNEKKYEAIYKIVIYFLWFGLAIAIAAIALSFFQNDMLAAEAKNWVDMINPCLKVCTREPCECIKMCKDAAKQTGNGACQSSATEFYKAYKTCC